MKNNTSPRNQHSSSFVSKLIVVVLVCSFGMPLPLMFLSQKNQIKELDRQADNHYKEIKSLEYEIDNLRTKLALYKGERIKQQAKLLGLLPPREEQVMVFDLRGSRVYDNVASYIRPRRTYGMDGMRELETLEQQNAAAEPRPLRLGDKEMAHN